VNPVSDTQGPLENACHEGHYTLRNILSAARADERDRWNSLRS